MATFADQAVIAIENVRLFGGSASAQPDLSGILAAAATADVLKVVSSLGFRSQNGIRYISRGGRPTVRGCQGTIARERDGVYQGVATYGFSDEFAEYVRIYPSYRNVGSQPDGPCLTARSCIFPMFRQTRNTLLSRRRS